MTIYLDKNVYEAAKERVRFVYQEFDNVVVSFSGGKDSTCVFQLALEVAREMNRLPVNVFFFDQEAEWTDNINYIRHVMNHPDVKPYWFQVPFKIDNAAGGQEKWVHCWQEGKEDEWIREKEDIAYKEHIADFGGREPEFYECLDATEKAMFPNQKVATLLGMRTQETPKRRMALTEGTPRYKWVLWCAKRDEFKYDFSPIYDWTFSDVWKYIANNHFEYCKVYDYMYQQGHKLNDLRISALIHETAIQEYAIVQEIDRELYNKLVQRIQGASMISKDLSLVQVPKKLPFMFGSWLEYRDYLTEHLLGEEEQILFKKYYKANDKTLICDNPLITDDYIYTCIKGIMLSEIKTCMGSLLSKRDLAEWKYWKKHGKKKYKQYNKYIDYEVKNGIAH